MDIRDAIRGMLKKSGKSARYVSAEMGKSKAFVSNTLNVNSGDVGAQLIASMAAPCGCVVAIVPSSDLPASALVIDPKGGPTRPADVKHGEPSGGAKSEVDLLRREVEMLRTEVEKVAARQNS